MPEYGFFLTRAFVLTRKKGILHIVQEVYWHFKTCIFSRIPFHNFFLITGGLGCLQDSCNNKVL